MSVPQKVSDFKFWKDSPNLPAKRPQKTENDSEESEEIEIFKFNEGDVVTLKSGGMRMTVESVIHPNRMIGMSQSSDIEKAREMGFEDGDLICIWFKRNEKKKGFFKASTIEIVE